MKNTWLWIALLLGAFNLLLGYSYITRREEIEQAFDEFTSGADVEDLVYHSEQIAFGFSYATRKPNLEVEFAQASRNFSRAINALPLPETNGDKISFFQKKMPMLQQDSLWLAYRNYRQAIDKLVARTLPERKDYYDRYIKITAIERELSHSVAVAKEHKKKLQQSLDSVTRFPDRFFKINIDDRKMLRDFISFMHFRSDPAEELELNNRLAKMDETFVAKGKMILYGKVFELNSLTEAERRQLFDYSVIIKSEADEQLYSFTR